MSGLVGTWLADAPLGLLMMALIVAGLGVPLPEDIVLLLAGALAHRGPTPLPVTIACCAVGVLLGDILLFSSARRLGTAALERGLFARLLPPKRRSRIEAMFERRGSVVIFVARHIAGLRAPVFAMAGIHRMPLRRFVLWDSLGILVSVPLMVTLGYLFSEHLDEVERGVGNVEHWAVVGAVVIFLIYVLSVGMRRARRSAK